VVNNEYFGIVMKYFLDLYDFFYNLDLTYKNSPIITNKFTFFPKSPQCETCHILLFKT